MNLMVAPGREEHAVSAERLKLSKPGIGSNKNRRIKISGNSEGNKKRAKTLGKRKLRKLAQQAVKVKWANYYARKKELEDEKR